MAELLYFRDPSALVLFVETPAVNNILSGSTMLLLLVSHTPGQADGMTQTRRAPASPTVRNMRPTFQLFIPLQNTALGPNSNQHWTRISTCGISFTCSPTEHIAAFDRKGSYQQPVKPVKNLTNTTWRRTAKLDLACQPSKRRAIP